MVGTLHRTQFQGLKDKLQLELAELEFKLHKFTKKLILGTTTFFFEKKSSSIINEVRKKTSHQKL